MSVIDTYKNLDSSNKFLVAFPFWLAVLFGLFYWGNYYSLSPIGECIDSAVRSIIMSILDSLLENPILGYDIVIDAKYRVVITPECNGLIPYLMILSAIVAYPCKMRSKVLFALSSFFIFFVVNIIRLYVVVWVVNSYGSSAFYLVHDVGGNLLLIATGAVIFLTYLGMCSAK